MARERTLYMREYMRKRRLEHPEKTKPVDRRAGKVYYQKNAETLRAKNREYRRSLYRGRPLEARYRHLRSRCQKRGRVFDLTLEEYLEMTTQRCSYCGQFSEACPGNKGGGVDRVDSKSGYTKSNCVPCCYRCNTMKNDLSVSDFLGHVKQILEFSTPGT